jgi:hypothetical protein
MNKMDTLLNLVRDTGVDVVAVGETWLTSGVPSSFVLLAGFEIVRGDTDSAVRKHGVCLFVRRGLKFVEVDLQCPNVVGVHLVDYDVWVLAVYRPPSYSDVQNRQLMELLLAFCAGREAVVLGDFNLPTLVWQLDDVVERYVTPNDLSFLECFTSVGLTQWVGESTFVSSGSILDLFLTSEPDRVGSVDVLAPLPRCLHCPVVCEYIFHVDLEREVDLVVRRRYMWHRGNYEAISRSLGHVDWDLEFMYLSVNDCYSRFVHILLQLVSQFVPEFTGGDKLPWSVRPPRLMCVERARAWQEYKELRSALGRADDLVLVALGVFNEHNLQYRNYALHCRSQYEQQLIDRFAESPKVFHSYIRRKKKGRLSVGPLRLPSGEIIDSPLDMSESFVEAFASVFVAEVPHDPAPAQVYPGSMPEVVIRRSDVVQVLQALDASSASGPDDLHPRLLKCCARMLSYPLFLIFEKSLRLGTLPDLWMESLIIPLFKSRSRYCPLNYRPVSLTSVCCKSMERIIVSHLVSYLEDSGILSPHQFGFRRSRSTDDQLILAYTDVSDWVDVGFVVDVVLLDYSKAFDVVCHSVLLSKLRDIGVGDELLSWIRSFLVGRSMKVVVDGVCSGSRDVLSGVPQGSVLGPVLFLVYVNHVTGGVLSSFKAFADDYKLYLRYKRDRVSALSGVSALQRDLDVVCSVAASWNLRLNADKCVVMRFSRGFKEWNEMDPLSRYSLNGVELKFVQSHRDLGVTVDTKLRFHQHVREVVGRASGLANNLLRSTVCRTPDFMVSLFVLHIRPLMDYCSCVWNTGYIGDLRLLESVQRRWTKNVEGLADMDYASRLRHLGLFSIKGRLMRSDLIKCWKIVRQWNGEVDFGGIFQFAPDRRTRGHVYKLLMPACATDIKRRMFGARCVQQWNSLPGFVVESDCLTTFKRLLVGVLGDALFEFH